MRLPAKLLPEKPSVSQRQGDSLAENFEAGHQFWKDSRVQCDILRTRGLAADLKFVDRFSGDRIMGTDILEYDFYGGLLEV